MVRITESTIESFAIELLDKLGYEYIYAPDIAPEFPSDGGVAEGRGDQDARDSYAQDLLLNRLQTSVRRINSSIPTYAQAAAIKENQRIASPELLTNNETFYCLLTEGIPVSKRVAPF